MASGGPGAVHSVAPCPAQARLEALLLEATNPANPVTDVNLVKQFCDTVGRTSEGPLLAARLLGHRIQSPQDQEALHALVILGVRGARGVSNHYYRLQAVLEATVKSCGPVFHAEVGKFRFLNEMIKLVSPKYLGLQRPQHVKQKVIELLFRWTKDIPEEKKIEEAYGLLKAQGVVGADPDYVTTAVFAASLPPREAELDEEQQKKLQKLLHSNNLEDLQTANMMIKSIVSKDEEKMERLSKRLQQLETTSSQVKLLHEMVESHARGGSTAEERQVMAELSSSCDKLRPGLYRLASELAEDDNSIGEILAASDELTRAMERHRELVVEGRSWAGAAPGSLLDLGPAACSREAGPLQELLLVGQDSLPADRCIDLMSGFEDLVACDAAPIPGSPARGPAAPAGMGLVPEAAKVPEVVSSVVPVSPKKGLQDLDLLGESLIKERLAGDHLTSFEVRKNEKLPLNCLKKELATKMEEGVVRIETKDLTHELCDDAGQLAPVRPRTPDNASKASQDDETKCDNEVIKTEAGPKWNDVYIEMAKIQPSKATSPIQLQVTFPLHHQKSHKLSRPGLGGRAVGGAAFHDQLSVRVAGSRRGGDHPHQPAPGRRHPAPLPGGAAARLPGEGDAALHPAAPRRLALRPAAGCHPGPGARPRPRGARLRAHLHGGGRDRHRHREGHPTAGRDTAELTWRMGQRELSSVGQRSLWFELGQLHCNYPAHHQTLSSMYVIVWDILASSPNVILTNYYFFSRVFDF
jgi:hypothetical protein